MYGNEISNFINIKSNEKTRQSTNNEIVRQKNRLRKTDKNIWHRVAIIFNSVSKSFNPQAPIGKKLESRQPTGIFFTSTKMNIIYAPGEYCLFVETETRITNSLSTEDTKGLLTTPLA